MILRQLVQCSLGLRHTVDTVAPGQWSLLARHGMLPLYRSFGGQVPKDLTQEQILQDSVCRHIRQCQDRALIAIHDALGAAGVFNDGHTLGLIKGAALGHRLYPQAECRPMADIDLLVIPAISQQVRAVLRQLGYEEYRSPYTHDCGRDHHGAPLHHKTLGVWVEVHTALYPSESPLAPAFVHATQALETYVIEQREFSVLPRSESFLYVLTHWAQVPQPYGKFHGLIDLALMLADEPAALLRQVNRVEHRQVARSILVVAALLRRCGASPQLVALDQKQLMRVAQFDRWRVRFLSAMAWQLSVSHRGGFMLAGEHLCAQWWVDVMHSRSAWQAGLKIAKRLFIPHDYGGPRGYGLQWKRLRALMQRLYKVFD